MPKIKPYTVTYVKEPIPHWIVKTPLGNLDVAVDAKQAMAMAAQMAADEEPGTGGIQIKIAWLKCPEGFQPPDLEDIDQDEIESSVGVN
jgi:hypothetical protein